jgi:hypothetical protein
MTQHNLYHANTNKQTLFCMKYIQFILQEEAVSARPFFPMFHVNVLRSPSVVNRYRSNATSTLHATLIEFYRVYSKLLIVQKIVLNIKYISH